MVADMGILVGITFTVSKETSLTFSFVGELHSKHVAYCVILLPRKPCYHYLDSLKVFYNIPLNRLCSLSRKFVGNYS